MSESTVKNYLLNDPTLGMSEDDRINLDTLLNEIEAGRVVLFVGAGMSADSGGPVGSKLAEELCQKFATDLDPSLGLPRIGDLLQNRQNINRLDIDNWIAERYERLQPSNHHLVVPKFSWPAIYTTNYDRLIEKGYDAQPKSRQRLRPIYSAAEDYDIYDNSIINLFKINGDITRLQDPNAPLVVSGADFRRTRKNRSVFLKRMGDLQRAHTWLFVGYSFLDNIIVELLEEMREVLGDHLLRWSYTLAPRATVYDRDFLRPFKVNVIPLDAKTFFDVLDARSAPPPDNEGTKNNSPRPNQSTSVPHIKALDEQFEVVGQRPFGMASPASMYRGNTPSWADLESRLDVRRDQADELDRLSRELIRRSRVAEENRTSAIVVTGSAGTGKSTLLRRLAYDLYASENVALIAAREGVQWDSRQVINLYKAVNKPIIVLIDAGEIEYQRLRSFYRGLLNHDIPAIVLIGARSGQWLMSQQRWGAFVADRSIEIRESFSENEVRALLDKLAAHNFIQLNAVTDASYYLSRARAANRLVLVVLLELVQNGRFEEIVLSEYQELNDTLAESAYRAVALVHELGITLRRELLKRMLDCDWETFIAKVLQGSANKVVIEDFETQNGKAFYRTKHPLIAKIIEEFTIDAPLEAFKALLANVDPGERDDQFTVRSIVKNIDLPKVLQEHMDRRALFEAAIAVLPNDIVIRHQMGINEMESKHFEEARRIFETCLNIDPNNVAVIHSFGQLELERARTLTPGPLQELLFDKALKYFEQVIDLDQVDEYGYHSAGALFLNRATASADQNTKLTFAAQALEMVQLGISEVDPREVRRLYDLRGQVLEFIGQLSAAREEYAQSIERGSATALTFYLLARLELEASNTDAAKLLITRGLAMFEDNPKLLALRAEFALTQNLGRAELVQILGPAVRTNPKRLSLSFALAVNLYKLGRIKEARDQFRQVRNLSKGIFAPGRVREMFQDTSGKNMTFSGSIERDSRKGGYLSVLRSDNQDPLYYNVGIATRAGILPNTNVSFNIGFSYRGTIALNLKRIA